MLDWLTPGVGTAIGAVGQLAGGIMQNAANAKQASAQMAFQERMVNQQNDFSREMFNSQLGAQRNLNAEARNWDAHMQGTAYQRAMNDMRSAGLNPMLAYMKGGAGTGSIGAGSAPSGSVPGAPSGAQARMENVTGGLASTAMEAAKLTPAVRLLQTQANQGQAQTDLIHHQKALVDAQTEQAKTNTALQAWQSWTEQGRRGLVDAETKRARAAAGLSSVQAESTQQEVTRFQNYGPNTTPGDLAAFGEAVLRRGAGPVAERPQLTPPGVGLPAPSRQSPGNLPQGSVGSTLRRLFGVNPAQ